MTDNSKDFWRVEQYRVWKGINPDKPLWSSIGFVSQSWEDMADLCDYLQGNNPEGIYRVIRGDWTQEKVTTALTYPDTLEQIKRLACTMGAPGQPTVAKGLATILHLCRRAGIEKQYDEIVPVQIDTEEPFYIRETTRPQATHWHWLDEQATQSRQEGATFCRVTTHETFPNRVLFEAWAAAPEDQGKPRWSE